MIEPLDLTDDELARLLEAFRLLAEEATGFSSAGYILVERESLKRVKNVASQW